MSRSARLRSERKRQSLAAAANREANPDKFKSGNVITGRAKPNPDAWTKKYTVDPNKRQMGRAAAKRRMEAAKEAKENKSGDITSSQYAKNNTGSTTAHKESHIKARGGLLRYPLEAMTDMTDYLQIDITKYQTV